jgi:hypothetical protein
MGNSDSKADNSQESEPGTNIPSIMAQAQKTSQRLHSITHNIISHCKSELYNKIES